MDNINVDILCSSAGVPSADEDGAATLAVASTADVRTHSHNIQGASAMVLMYKAKVDSGSVDVDLYLEQGPDAPTTEGQAGDAVDGWHQIGNKIADVLDENWHSVTLSPVVLPRLRILADGQGANPASCKMIFKLGKQEALAC